jgi:hypothetical protein
VHPPHNPGHPPHNAGYPAAAAEAYPAAAAEAPPLLSRRVPQAHLAPELRRRGQEQAAPAARADGRLPDAAEAREALSRYQASRQAARAMVDEGDTGSQHPTAGGWS